MKVEKDFKKDGSGGHGKRVWLLLRIVATMVKPTSEKMPPKAIFLRSVIRMPHRSQTGKPMTSQMYISLSREKDHLMDGILPKLPCGWVSGADRHVGAGRNCACTPCGKEGKIREVHA